MKSCSLIAILLFIGVSLVKGVTVPEEPIDCGSEKIVPFGNCVSPDNNYAIGWTIRPKGPSAKPVDWSLWKNQEPWTFLELYNTDIEDPKSTYVAVNCVIDLRSKKILDLPCERPYLPNTNHQYLRAIWSELQESTRYALVQNDFRFFTNNLWLVTLKQSDIHQLDLAAKIQKAVSQEVREKMPLAYADYGTFFNMGIGGSEIRAVFEKSQVVVPFMSSVPKSNSDPEVTGSITIDLSTCAIVNATSDTKREDPLSDVPELAQSDKLLNRAYAELSQKLDAGGQKKLKLEQLHWISQRNENAREQAIQVSDGDDIKSVKAARDQSLLKSTQDRIKELQQRLKNIK